MKRRVALARFGAAVTLAAASALAWGVPSAAQASGDYAPRSVAAVPGNTGGTVSVTWQAPVDDDTVALYIVQARDASGAAFKNQNAIASATSASVSGLSNGDAYTFVVYSQLTDGTTHASAPSDTVVPFTVPNAPTQPTATRLEPGKVSVSWAAPSNGGSAITGYTVTCNPTVNCPSQTVALTTAEFSGLDQATAYTFSVVATNARGSSTPSPASAAITPFGLPGAPTGLAATAGNAQATVSWTAPASNGGSDITNYEYRLGSGAWTAFNPADTESPAVIPGLINGTTYTVRLRAINAAGGGAESTSVTVTPGTTPLAPTALTASPGDASATVSFTAGSDGGSPITNYDYQLSQNAGGTWGAWTALSPAKATTPITITGLVNGTAYSIRIRARNAVGAGAESSAVSVTPRGVPGAPTGVSVTAGDGSASVAFTAPSSTGGSPITNYDYQLGSDPWVTRSPASTVSPLVITGLTNGRTYQVRIRARNATGPGTETAAVSVTPAGPPAAPTGLSAVAGDRSATITFTAGATNGAPITNYQYSLNGSATWTPLSPDDTSSPVTISGLTNGTAYGIRLRAVNSAGPGPASTSVSVTPTGSSASPSPTESPAPNPTTSPSPSPSPTTSPSPSPSPSPTTSPSPSPSPTTSPTPSPSPTAPPRPTPGPPGGLVPADPVNAETVSVKRPPATSQRSAPVVSVPRGDAFIVKLRGLPERARFITQVKSGSRWVKVGTTRSNAAGRTRLPALDGRRVGEYVVRLRGPDGSNFYVKVRVTRDP